MAPLTPTTTGAKRGEWTSSGLHLSPPSPKPSPDATRNCKLQQEASVQCPRLESSFRWPQDWNKYRLLEESVTWAALTSSRSGGFTKKTSCQEAPLQQPLGTTQKPSAINNKNFSVMRLPVSKFYSRRSLHVFKNYWGLSHKVPEVRRLYIPVCVCVCV